MDSNKIGKFIVECRKAKKMTQEDLAKTLNYSRNNISKWERGVSFPSDPSVIKKLAEVLDISIEELMYGEKKNEKNTQSIINTIIKEYETKHKAYKKKSHFLYLSILFIIILIFIIIYYAFIRGTINVYKLNFTDETYSTNDSFLILSNNVSILYFNKLETNKEDIINLELYYFDNNVKNIIFNGENDDYYITEDNGYDEYKLTELKNKDIYLKIKNSSNQSKTIKLSKSKIFSNTNILPKKTTQIGDTQNSEKVGNYNILYKYGFTSDDNYNFANYINDNTYLIYSGNNFHLTRNTQNSIETIDSQIDSYDYIYYIKKDNEEKTKNLKPTKEINCQKEKCTTIEDYVNYINFLKNKIIQN